ncbi:MAG: DUF192 domain-containing protein [Anaerolineales bacterium]|jgi:uncharacterized membrane protein (UPF0127 family)|nr:DUF192 domain-containing protein [Anaerolineales bacterium]
MMKVNVINETRSLEKPLRVKNCDTFFCRLLGLMFRKEMDSADGLLLVQKKESRGNAAIHMFFVGMDLGVIWLNNNREIVDIQLAESWKPMYTPKYPARYVLEITPDRIPDFNLGDKLDFEKNYQD